MAKLHDWAHQLLIDVLISAGGVAGERRRRSSDVAAARARTSVRTGGLIIVLHTGLQGILGEVLGGPRAWRTGGGASSAKATRRRLRELGLRRADGLAWPTRGRASSLGERERASCAQTAS
jgi:hypothetical protein